jgi:hypothetical protein
MAEMSTIGLDLAKTVFQVHGAEASGGFCRKLGFYLSIATNSHRSVAMEPTT